MDQHRWKAVNHIFHAALEVSPSERGRFVTNASCGDEAIEKEVMVLLDADKDAGSYIDTPIIGPNAFHAAITSWFPGLGSGDVLCGRFQILREVGEGGMGHVFAAFDTELRVQVALKIIRPEFAADPEALARFRQEVRLARTITHRNVCRTFDLERESRPVDGQRGSCREIVFLTMEFLEGETLAARIKREGSVPLNEAIQIAHQVAAALDAAHSLGIVHRDIKPGNIVLSSAEDGRGFRAVVTDFGLARATGVLSGGTSSFSNVRNPIGTLAYMAPEQLEGRAVSSATDVYAFGLVLFEMVTGRRAFPSDMLLGGYHATPDRCASGSEVACSGFA